MQDRDILIYLYRKSKQNGVTHEGSLKIVRQEWMRMHENTLNEWIKDTFDDSKGENSSIS